MKELVEYIAKSIVDKPEDVSVDEGYGDGVVLTLHVAPDDMGKVIGRQGRIASAIRALLKVAAIKQGARVILNIE
jgi:predicted RNA-binding protein YlqC (UPF0109 family)|tara:strand:- start:227 stop:451 length:225 start_codon:yes stop_codon:yes gene_type:complete